MTRLCLPPVHFHHYFGLMCILTLNLIAFVAFVDILEARRAAEASASRSSSDGGETSTPRPSTSGRVRNAGDVAAAEAAPLGKGGAASRLVSRDAGCRGGRPSAFFSSSECSRDPSRACPMPLEEPPTSVPTSISSP
jgi:hypothetical protein